jgi:hypothetical protein
MASNDFRAFLREARAALTVDGAFEQFLAAQINISKGTRRRASVSQQHIREFLVDEHDRDPFFPRILEGADFLGGSFARHTKVWPLDDIDVYFPIDGQGLVYTKRGLAQPFTVVTDGVLDENPLIMDPERWMSGNYISSRKLIDGFAEVLGRHYHASKVRRIGEAVNVRFTQGANEESDGLGFDVVPGFLLHPQNPGEREFYMIPDGEDGWIRTNPRLDQEISDELNRNNGRTLRKGTKCVKWWNDQKLGGRLRSYYIELAVMRAFSSANQNGIEITSISGATATAFRAVRDAAQTGDQDPILQGAPPVKRGDITDRDMQRLDQAVDRCNLAILYEELDRDAEAIATWRLIFGDSFPET